LYPGVATPVGGVLIISATSFLIPASLGYHRALPSLVGPLAVLPAFPLPFCAPTAPPESGQNDGLPKAQYALPALRSCFSGPAAVLPLCPPQRVLRGNDPPASSVLPVWSERFPHSTQSWQ